MLKVKAIKTVKLAKRGAPAEPQVAIYAGRTYTVSATDERGEGVLPSWAAIVADEIGALEKVEEKSTKKTKKASE